jgi:hypothetical protein
MPAQNAFRFESKLLCDAATGCIIDGCLYLYSMKSQIVETETYDRMCCVASQSLSSAAASDPKSQTGSFVLDAQITEAATAQKLVRERILNGKEVSLFLFPPWRHHFTCSVASSRV